MDDDLRARLAKLEERLAALEARLPAAPVPGPERAPRPVAPPPLPAALPSAPADRRAPPAPDYERFVGLAVMGRIGIAAVLLAAAWFGQMGWRGLGPGARMFVIELAGLLLVALGFALRPRVRAAYVALLWGGGTALLYLGGVLGHLRFDVLPAPVALVGALASAGLGQFLARRIGLQAMAVVALGGAYAAPVLVAQPAPTPTTFFALLLLLHAWAAWTEALWKWHAARGLAVAATVGLAVAWYVENGTVAAPSFALHTGALWLALAAPELLVVARGRSVAAHRAVLAGIGLGALLLAVLVVTLVRGELRAAALVGSLAAIGAGALLARRASLFGAAIAGAGALLLASGFYAWMQPQPDHPASLRGALLGLGGIAAGLLASRRWTGIGDFGAAFAAAHGWLLFYEWPSATWAWSPVAVLPGALLLFAGRGSGGRTAGLVLGALAAYWWVRGSAAPSWGDRAAALAAAGAIVALGAIAAAWRRDRVLGWVAAVLQAGLVVAWLLAAALVAGGAGGVGRPVWNGRTAAGAALVLLALAARARLPAAETPVRAVLAATALLAGWATGLVALLDVLAASGFGARAVAVSLYTLCVAGILLVVGFRRRLLALRWTALGTFGVVVAKIGLHDLRGLDTPLRVLATGALGVVLLLAAWAYARAERAAQASALPAAERP
jgi:hypothetical protein